MLNKPGEARIGDVSMKGRPVSGARQSYRSWTTSSRLSALATRWRVRRV